MLDLLKGTAINCLLIEKNTDLEAIASQARKQGLTVVDTASPPAGVAVVQGEWPGVKLNESGFLDRASAGPTGIPWVDSNGWKIRLTAALRPGTEIWVDAVSTRPRVTAQSYLVAVADAAAYGGRWIISLDNTLAVGIAGHRPQALNTWKRIVGATGFFAARRTWSDYLPEAVVGIISDFSGQHEFMGQELLNLVARTNQQYRVIVKSTVSEAALGGLQALLYADEEPPAPQLREQVLAFVRAGGMLITGRAWGQLPGAQATGADHPRYALSTLGKGRVAVAKGSFDDPFLVANDSQVLISHRYDLLRFWNGGAVGSCFAVRPDRKLAVVQLLFYAFGLGDHRPTVRVAGRYRTARLWTLDQEVPRSVESEIQKDAVELHLPPIAGYAGVELEV